MKRELRAYLELVRLPNLFTAAADVFAGFFYAPAFLEEWPILVRLSLASMCLYGGGVALNDVCDAKRDAIDRPERPIPSGRVALGNALRLSITLLILGIAIAASVSLQSAAVAALLTLAVVLYDFVLKRTIIAPAVMGACRGLNIALGMYGVSHWAANPNLWRPVAILWLYITCVTVFARTESRQSSRWRLALATVGMCMAIGHGVLTMHRWSWQVTYDEFLYPVAALLIWIAYNGLVAVAQPTPAVVQRSVKRFILALIVLDACIAWSVGGPDAAALTASLLIPTIILARVFRVT